MFLAVSMRWNRMGRMSFPDSQFKLVWFEYGRGAERLRTDISANH